MLCGGPNEGTILMDQQNSLFFSWQSEIEIFLITVEKRSTGFASSLWDMISIGPITGCSSIYMQWCKWWQIPSSLIMHVKLIGVTHSDRHVLALGWGAELPDWIIQQWPVIVLSGHVVLSSSSDLCLLSFSSPLSIPVCEILKHISIFHIMFLSMPVRS